MFLLDNFPKIHQELKHAVTGYKRQFTIGIFLSFYPGGPIIIRPRRPPANAVPLMKLFRARQRSPARDFSRNSEYVAKGQPIIWTTKHAKRN